MLPRSSRPRAAWGTGVYPSKQYFDIKMRCLRFSCAARKAKRRQILVLFRRIFRFSFCTSHEIQHFLRFGCRSRYISRYVNLKFGFLPFVVASIVAMVFLTPYFAARAPAMGNSADRAWQLSQLVEGVLTAFNPSHGSLSCVQAGRCVSKQIGRHDAACQGCPRCVSRSPVLGTPQSRMALWGEEKQRSD